MSDRLPSVDIASWRPPEGFIQVDSKEAGVVVTAPAPPPEDEPPPETFRCERCGNQSRHIGGQSHVLQCEHCGTRASITAPHAAPAAVDLVPVPAPVGVGIVPGPAPSADAGAAAPAPAPVKNEFRVSTLEATRGWGAEKREVHCDNCGADFVVGPGVLTAECTFCESHRVVVHTAAQEAMRPTEVAPFVVNEDGAKDLIKSWLGRGKFVPPGLVRKASASLRVHGVYLPYWMFDAHVRAQWRCEVGRRVKRGDNYVTEWSPRSGLTTLNRTNERVVGVRDGISGELLAEAEPFPIAELKPYRPDFLAGWQARAANLGLEEAYARARTRMRDDITTIARRDVNEPMVRNFTANVTYDNEKWRLVLLPVHTASFEWEGERWPVLINGLTAELAGQKPIDKKAFAKFGALAMTPGAVVSVGYAIAHRFFHFFNPTVNLVGYGLLLVGALYTGYMWSKHANYKGE